MIIDLNSFIGSWPSHPVKGETDQVWPSLRHVGVTHIFVSHLSAVWCRNPHVYNRTWFEAVDSVEDVWPVPILDPTVADWRGELERASEHGRVQLVRLLPNYGRYDLADVSDFLQAIQDVNLAVIVQACLEDSRRHHPLAVVPSVAASAVVDMAQEFPDLRIVIGGAKAAELRNLADRILALPNVYADTAQVDGLDAIKVLVSQGLGGRLVFGSHAPLFIPHAALGRVVTDVEDDVAEAILSGNALCLLGDI
jgi:predicted TIM-barrel fold metal-dependent hydrolase